jgi:metal-responsive CopG/Arc/MetJ family transcriptional regulator
MPRLVVNIEDDLLAEIENRCAAEDRDKDRVVVRALRHYLATSEGIVGQWPPPVERKDFGDQALD